MQINTKEKKQTKKKSNQDEMRERKVRGGDGGGDCWNERVCWLWLRLLSLSQLSFRIKRAPPTGSCCQTASNQRDGLKQGENIRRENKRGLEGEPTKPPSGDILYSLLHIITYKDDPVK